MMLYIQEIPLTIFKQKKGTWIAILGASQTNKKNEVLSQERWWGKRKGQKRIWEDKNWYHQINNDRLRKTKVCLEDKNDFEGLEFRELAP